MRLRATRRSPADWHASRPAGRADRDGWSIREPSVDWGVSATCRSDRTQPIGGRVFSRCLVDTTTTR